MDRVELDGLDLRLRKNPEGTGNWENFGQGPKRAENAGSDQVGGQTPALAGIQITHGRVSYQDIVVEKFNLETGAFGGHGGTPGSISFSAKRGAAGGRPNLNGEIHLCFGAAVPRPPRPAGRRQWGVRGGRGRPP